MEKIRLLLRKFFDKLKYKLWHLKRFVLLHRKHTLIVVIALVLFLTGTLWFLLRTYHGYEVMSYRERNSDTSANLYFRDDGIVCYSKDGISFTNDRDETLWNQVFGMTAPKMDACGDFMALGDIGANSLYIFNGQGTQGKIALEKPLEDFRVSKQGVVAAILADGEANQINIYSKTGETLASIKASIGATGYPLTLALSEDAERMVVSYVVFNGGKIESQLVFYNFSSKENSAEPAGSFVYDQIIPKVEFVSSDTVLACGENGFATYHFKDIVNEKVKRCFDSEIKSIFITDDHVGFIRKNMKEAKEGQTPDKYVLEVYNFRGRKTDSFTFDFDYKYVTATDRDIILYNDWECHMYTYYGKCKFQYTFEHNIEKILPGKQSGEYIILDAQSVQTIRLK